MALARHNRPSIIIYGGTMKGGYSKLLKKPIDINTCYEAQGALLSGKLQAWTEDKSITPDMIMTDIEKNAWWVVLVFVVEGPERELTAMRALMYSNSWAKNRPINHTSKHC